MEVKHFVTGGAQFVMKAAPATIPTHFNIQGVPDSYGGKASFIFLPIVGIVLYTLLARYPHIYNYPRPITQENSARQYRLARTLLLWLNLVVCWLFAYIQWGTIQAALHQTQGLFAGVLIGAITIPLFSVVFYLVVSAREK
jgi:uncharacterized membrane protein